MYATFFEERNEEISIVKMKEIFRNAMREEIFVERTQQGKAGITEEKI